MALTFSTMLTALSGKALVQAVLPDSDPRKAPLLEFTTAAVEHHKAPFQGDMAQKLAEIGSKLAAPLSLAAPLNPLLAGASKIASTAAKFTNARSAPVFTDANGNFSLGATAETLLQIALNRANTPDVGPQPSMLPGGWTAQQVALPALPSLGSMLGGAGRIIAAGVGVVRTAAGRIAGFVLANGRKVSVRDAAALAAQVGITAAAATLGASESEVAEAVLQAMKRRGQRGRGITASALRTTRRTIGKLERAHKAIAKAARQHVR